MSFHQSIIGRTVGRLVGRSFCFINILFHKYTWWKGILVPLHRLLPNCTEDKTVHLVWSQEVHFPVLMGIFVKWMRNEWEKEREYPLDESYIISRNIFSKSTPVFYSFFTAGVKLAGKVGQNRTRYKCLFQSEEIP